MTTNRPALSTPTAEAIPRTRSSGSAQLKSSVIGAAPYGSHEPGSARQGVPGPAVLEKARVADQFDSQRRCGVVMLDGEQATRVQPASGEADDGGYHRHAVRSAEQGVGWIMLGHFGFQKDIIGNVGRVGNHEVYLSVEFGKQSRHADVG